MINNLIIRYNKTLNYKVKGKLQRKIKKNQQLLQNTGKSLEKIFSMWKSYPKSN